MPPILGLETLTLKRSAAGTWDANGEFVAGTAATPVSFKGSVQGPSQRVLETLPEGERQRGVKVIYTKTELRTGNQHTGTLADVIEYNDGAGLEDWEVRIVERWPKLLSHFQATIVRVQEAA